METHTREGVMKKFPNFRKPFYQRACGEFWNLRVQHNREGKKKKNPQNRRLPTTPSGEVAQTLASATSERGLNREAQIACLG